MALCPLLLLSPTRLNAGRSRADRRKQDNWNKGAIVNHRTIRSLGRGLLSTIIVGAGVLTLGPSIGPSTSNTSIAHAAASGLHVQGNQLVNTSSQPVIL